MSQVLLVGNPIKRKRKTAAKRKSTRKASPAQLRARAKFAAMARARAGKTKRRASPKRKSRTSTAVTRSNPIVAKRRSPKRRTHVAKRRTRRNPISGRGITAMLVPALKQAGLGAAGAIGVDVAFGFVQSYLPAGVQSPTDATGGVNYAYYAAKGAAAFAIAMGVRKLVGGNKAAHVLNGSLTVTLHDMAKGLMGTYAPSMTMGQYIGPTPGLSNMPGGRVVALPSSSLRGMQQYITAQSGGLGAGSSGTAQQREARRR